MENILHNEKVKKVVSIVVVTVIVIITITIIRETHIKNMYWKPHSLTD